MSIKVIGCELTEMKATILRPRSQTSCYQALKWSILKIDVHLIWPRQHSRIMHQLYSKCSMIISKMILSRQSKRWSHQARLPITSQLSSYNINLYTNNKVSDSLIKQSTNPHIVSHPKIISQPSPCEINPELKLLILYLVRPEGECVKLEKTEDGKVI